MRIPSDYLEARPRPDAPARSVPSMPAARPAPVPLPAQATGGPTQEIGGPSGPEPTRYGDWERNGRCIDF